MKTKKTTSKEKETLASRKAGSRKKTELVAVLSKIKQRNYLLPLVIIILAGTLYYFKNQFIVATVDGKPIFRLTLIRELEKKAGKEVLDSLITEILILQEAKKENVVISEDEIKEEIRQIEESFSSQGQDLDQLLEVQGMTRDELGEQIRVQKIVEEIVGKDISVTDEEIDEYIEENKDFIPQESDIGEVRASVKGQLEQQKVNEKAQLWIQSLQDKAKINNLLRF